MKAILLLVLSVIILSQSFGSAYAVHISGHLLDENAEVPILTIETDSSSYVEGDMISVSGSISDYVASDPYSNFDVTLRLLDPKNNITIITNDLQNLHFTTMRICRSKNW